MGHDDTVNSNNKKLSVLSSAEMYRNSVDPD